MNHIGKVDVAPFYLPWMGASYEQLLESALDRVDRQPGAIPLIHVMGESHYIDAGAEASENSPDLTRRVVQEWAMKRRKGGQFFTKIAQAIQGRPADEVDRPRAWASIAYSNFVQQPLGGSRLAPTPEMWTDARSRFFGQLAITRPSILVVLGQRNWASLPADVGESASSKGMTGAHEIGIEAWCYPYEVDGISEQALAIKAAHPSGSKFNWQVVAEHIEWAAGSFRLMHPRY